MHLLVTGTAGFIGFHFAVARLKKVMWLLGLII